MSCFFIASESFVKCISGIDHFKVKTPSSFGIKRQVNPCLACLGLKDDN